MALKKGNWGVSAVRHLIWAEKLSTKYTPSYPGRNRVIHTFFTNILSLKGLFIPIFKSGIGIVKSGKAE